jgi:hypothetical protein
MTILLAEYMDNLMKNLSLEYMSLKKFKFRKPEYMNTKKFKKLQNHQKNFPENHSNSKIHA